jgi:hypothetical protein
MLNILDTSISPISATTAPSICASFTGYEASHRDKTIRSAIAADVLSRLASRNTLPKWRGDRGGRADVHD